MTTINTAQLYAAYEASKKSDLKTLPEGIHRLTVVDCKVDESGKPFLTPIYNDSSGDRVLLGREYATEKSAGILAQNLIGFGLGRDYLAQGLTLTQVAKDLIGRVVDIQVTQDEYPPESGEFRNSHKIGGIKLVGIQDAGGVVHNPDGSPVPPPPPPVTPTVPSAVPGQPVQTVQTVPVPPPTPPVAAPAAPVAASPDNGQPPVPPTVPTPGKPAPF